MTYSFFCKNCGDSFSSSDKSKVKSYRENHKVKWYLAGRVSNSHCRLQKTLRGTLARPELAIIINTEIEVNNA